MGLLHAQIWPNSVFEELHSVEEGQRSKDISWLIALLARGEKEPQGSHARKEMIWGGDDPGRWVGL